MEELNDKDFDQLFKNRISEELPAFEEESWSKMEEKLNKKDRLVYKYASLIAILLSLGLVFYLMTRKLHTEVHPIAIKKHKNTDQSSPVGSNLNSIRHKSVLTKSDPVALQLIVTEKSSSAFHQQHKQDTIGIGFSTKEGIAQNQEWITIAGIPKLNDGQDIADQRVTPDQNLDPIAVDSLAAPVKKTKTKRRIPLSFAISAGPDLSSTRNLIGGKPGMNIGVSVAIGLTKKLGVQTGVNYGTKNYSAGAYDYQFNNPNVSNIISTIDATCKVLEIPLTASYKISENKKNSIEINTGLSSYFMLNEKYVFVYTPASGRSDRITKVDHQNDHLLSVVDLSATYNIRLKNKKFALGISPYVKIPLSGIGEGNVPLKSSGLSLKIRYDVQH
jgi:hypothetical protein